MSKDIKHLFDISTVPAPRADLMDRIVDAAQAQSPLTAANDRQPWRQRKGFWSAAVGIAATVVVGFFVLTAQPSDAELWETHAHAAGFGDLYAWVDSEDTLQTP